MHNLGILKLHLMSKQKIRIKIKSFDHKVIDDACRMIIETAQKTGAIVMGPIPLPTLIDRFTVNKSTFVHKNSREQYEMRTHKRLVDITESSSATIEELSNLSLPSGVDIEIKMIMEQGEHAEQSVAKSDLKKTPKKTTAKKTAKKA
ncbi:30S ribosomal protein S10 [Candidatus Peregrinibacteria bacterium RIFCSPLOWO2_01_FULL_48_20]|nr:MAG: 30S ribosomal protein S10 [Candidatus Peregrinibacteria bacterium RIFCSPLOWO2_01_FULL_48_20]